MRFVAVARSLPPIYSRSQVWTAVTKVRTAVTFIRFGDHSAHPGIPTDSPDALEPSGTFFSGSVTPDFALSVVLQSRFTLSSENRVEGLMPSAASPSTTPLPQHCSRHSMDFQRRNAFTTAASRVRIVLVPVEAVRSL